MPIEFTIEPDGEYFVSSYLGAVTDEEMQDGYRAFLGGKDWRPAMNELVDLSQADLTKLTAAGLQRLATTILAILEELGVASFRTAVYAPADLPYGIARMYEAFSDESPEAVRVFRSLTEAKAWVVGQHGRSN